MKTLTTKTKLDIQLNTVDVPSGKKVLLGIGDEVYPLTAEDSRNLGVALIDTANHGTLHRPIDVTVLDQHPFIALAMRFPTLRYADGLMSQSGLPYFQPDVFDEWAVSASRCSAARWAARFVLHAYDSTRKWKSGAFDIFAARASWDSEHRAVFREWFKNG